MGVTAGRKPPTAPLLVAILASLLALGAMLQSRLGIAYADPTHLYLVLHAMAVGALALWLPPTRLRMLFITGAGAAATGAVLEPSFDRLGVDSLAVAAMLLVIVTLGVAILWLLVKAPWAQRGPWILWGIGQAVQVEGLAVFLFAGQVAPSLLAGQVASILALMILLVGPLVGPSVSGGNPVEP